MGEDIFNFVLSDISGIPSLPVFIGNYLLDLLSEFFPIFILLSSFVMVYIGFTRGSGDWKQTGQQLAPTAVSIAVIMGLLSMKTPYSDSNGNGLNGEFWKDVNSYTVVEMMNTFLGFGNIFADSLTHKIIYGSIEVSDKSGDNGFNGYFPSVLQAIIEKDKSKKEELKKLLTDKADHSSIYNKLAGNYSKISADTKILIKNLYYLGIIEDHTKIRSGFENSVGSTSSYDNLKLKEYIVFDKNTEGSLLKYNQPRIVSGATNIKNVDTSSKNGQENILSLNIPISHEKLLEGMNQSDTIKLDDAFKKFSGGSLSNISGPIDDDKLFSYLSKNNFSQEKLMIKNINELLSIYAEFYKIYGEEIDRLKADKQNFLSQDKKEEAGALDKLILDYVDRRKNVRVQIENGAYLEKDLSAIYSFITGEESISGGNVESILSTIDLDYNSLGRYKSISIDEEREIKNAYQSIENVNLPPMFFKNDSSREADISKLLNNIMSKKAYITNVIFDKYKDILKDDSIFQLSMGFPSNTPFNSNFFNENAMKGLMYLDNKKKDIVKEFLNESGKIDVASKLRKAIKEQHAGTDFGEGKIIHWTDLGKHYATFKNLFSPMITNIYTMEKVNSVDVEKVASVAMLMEELEPSRKNERLLDVAYMFSGGKLILGASKVLNKSNVDEKKKDGSPWSSFWDAIKIIGGVYFAIFFVNVVLPAFIWMFAIVTYYIEMSMYVAVFPIGFMFMIFQSYRQSLHQYINMLLGFILMPIILVSMYFVVLYIDMLLPMFFKQFMPFFGSYNEFTNAFNVAFGSQSNMLQTIAGDVIKSAGSFIESAGGTGTKESFLGNDVTATDTTNLIGQIGNFIYTILSLLMSALLLMTFFRANEYMSKILNVTTVGMDSFQGRETINKFGSFDKSGMTAGIIGR